MALVDVSTSCCKSDMDFCKLAISRLRVSAVACVAFSCSVSAILAAWALDIADLLIIQVARMAIAIERAKRTAVVIRIVRKVMKELVFIPVKA